MKKIGVSLMRIFGDWCELNSKRNRAEWCKKYIEIVTEDETCIYYIPEKENWSSVWVFKDDNKIEVGEKHGQTNE